jgi:hypothetical protein
LFNAIRYVTVAGNGAGTIQAIKEMAAHQRFMGLESRPLWWRRHAPEGELLFAERLTGRGQLSKIAVHGDIAARNVS